MTEQRDEGIDWEATTYAGNRRRQHLAFRALSFRDKVRALEDLDEVAAQFGAGKAGEGERERDREGSGGGGPGKD